MYALFKNRKFYCIKCNCYQFKWLQLLYIKNCCFSSKFVRKVKCYAEFMKYNFFFGLLNLNYIRKFLSRSLSTCTLSIIEDYLAQVIRAAMDSISNNETQSKLPCNIQVIYPIIIWSQIKCGEISSAAKVSNQVLNTIRVQGYSCVYQYFLWNRWAKIDDLRKKFVDCHSAQLLYSPVFLTCLV